MSAPDPDVVYVDLRFTQKPDGYDGPRWQPWDAIIISGDNYEPLFKSTERWTNKADAERAIELAFGGRSNVFLREPGQSNRPLRMAVR
jgi:hypothetical protein